MLFTIFTPIYNRKHTIHRVWESLRSQSNKNFEWIIVDDGSEDEIHELLISYQNKADFDVRIFIQENSGKHIAFNLAIDEARGELFIPSDSDDSFVSTTIETFQENWDKFKDENVSGIDVLCMDENTNLIGDKFPKQGISNYKEVYFKHKVKGEKWGCVRTDILKEFRFPTIMGASYFPENYLWAQIGLKYNTVYLNIPLRKYFQDSGNQIMNEDEISFGALNVEVFNSIWWLNNIYPSVKEYISIIGILKRYYWLWKAAFLIDKPYKSVISKLNSSKSKLMAYLTLIPSFMLVKVFRL